MKRSLIITVAGMSSRFNRDLDAPVLKCLYHEGDAGTALLNYQISSLYPDVDEIVVVGGFRYDDLTRFCATEVADPDRKIRLVYNGHYADWGSGYSLILGIRSLSAEAEEVVFIEGDLFFDAPGIRQVLASGRDVVTINREPIRSDKAVVLYVDMQGGIHYLYDVSHAALEIREPFLAVYNSAQIWKFRNPARLKSIPDTLSEAAVRGTNLEIIQRYFGPLPMDQVEVACIREWFNCNTVHDYRQAINTLIYENAE